MAHNCESCKNKLTWSLFKGWICGICIGLTTISTSVDEATPPPNEPKGRTVQVASNN